MNTEPGTFFVIEGTDGSGKGTQFKLLAERLQTAGYDIATFDFPQYEEPSSYFIKQYLNGVYGSSQEVGPYTASLFYALDRYEASTGIRQALKQGKIVLCNRFTGSNMAHQGTKFNHPEERRGFYIWLDNLEFQLLRVPRPTKNIVLRIDANYAQQLVDQKEARSYTDKKRDLHEADLNHLQRSIEVYDELCELFPKDFQRLDCIRDNRLLEIETVHELLWKTIQPFLPPQPQSKTAKSQIVTKEKPVSHSPLVEHKKNGAYQITDEGKHYLRDVVTNTDESTYAFTDKLSQVTIAAAMARLSRRGDDMRVTILDEFAENAHKDEQLLKRVITAYGDDSVQQLAGQHIVVENASNLLTKKLEWGRLASYLEQSTRYIFFDQKDAQGNYRYFIPPEFNRKHRQVYLSAMDFIFDTYSTLVRQLTDYVRQHSTVPKKEQDVAWKGATRAQACDAARGVLPVATTSTVGIYASGQALESLIMHLLADELPEARKIGNDILHESRKVLPVFLERADKPERGGAAIAFKAETTKNTRRLAADMLPDSYSASDQPVTLTDWWPKNELDLVADMLYEHSQLSLEEIRQVVNGWKYDAKAKVIQTYIGDRLNRRHKPGRALEKAHYSWDILCDYGIFRDLQRHRIVDDMEWQKLTPRYGYEIPSLVDEAGLSELYEQCFDKSLELYSYLQTNGFDLASQYAVLLGHRMRWKVTYNAREAFHLHELRTSPQGHPGYRKLVKQMHEKLCEVHPLIGEGMKFVNKDEDPELTRLAAERYTQFKLNQIDSKPSLLDKESNSA